MSSRLLPMQGILFDERAFSPRFGFGPAHETRVCDGYSRMRSSRTVICGLARDLGDGVGKMIFRLEQLGSLFLDYKIVIVENSSSDETRENLKAWAKTNDRVILLDADAGVRRYGHSRERDRTEMLALLRERYRRFVVTYCSLMDFAIVVDMDLGGGWSPAGVADTFGQASWDAVTSNGLVYVQLSRKGRKTNFWRQIYYDTWAFRTPGHAEAYPDPLINRLHLQRGCAMIPVTSAFGGMAVYRMVAFASSRYSGDDCEHVGFHFGMRKLGYSRIFLNPSQIVLYNRPPRGAIILAHSFSLTRDDLLTVGIRAEAQCAS